MQKIKNTIDKKETKINFIKILNLFCPKVSAKKSLTHKGLIEN